MSNSLVVRRGTVLAKRIKALRAAQYVRMSTDFQRYSIENQAASIATYAQQRHFTIVRTYVDQGRSGLRIKGRAGLIELIEDVQSGRADFDHILVYDVSRWGRFQDVDESAHYEFICKQNGVKVAYCAEQFDNDGSLVSSIVKNIKRVMAAEYSRELSVKVHTGQSRVAGLGFRVGGPLTFGLRREMVDENLHPKGSLAKGQRKSLQTDRVRLRLGSDKEAEIVKRIFHQFVVEKLTYSEIARRLNRAGVENPNDRPWTDGMVKTILKNENYVGSIVYNRTTRRLGQTLVNNPQHLWIRSQPVIEPVVERSIFTRAQKIAAERYVIVPEEQMLSRLRKALVQKGKLNSAVIGDISGLPSATSYVKHFGSLRKAYALIGYKPPRNYDWIDTRDYRSSVLAEHTSELALALHARADAGGAGLTVGNKKVSLVTARYLVKKRENHAAEWRAYRRIVISGLLIIIRLDRTNRAIEDYLVLPPKRRARLNLRFTESNLAQHNAVRINDRDGLIREIKSRLGRKLPRR